MLAMLPDVRKTMSELEYRRRVLILFFNVIVVAVALGQEKLIDPRDNQSYEIGLVNGQWWMLENLQWETELSFSFTEEQKVKYPTIQAGWYHLEELDEVCPEGWRLPAADDWVSYFNLLAEEKGAKPKIKTRRTHTTITNFSDEIDLFEAGNPLKIVPAGIFQGTEFIHAPESADFWIHEMPHSEGHKEPGFKHPRFTHPHTSHIHLYNAFTQIHSHEHHLKAHHPETLRRFMVRCIKIDK